MGEEHVNCRKKKLKNAWKKSPRREGDRGRVAPTGGPGVSVGGEGGYSTVQSWVGEVVLGR